MFKPKIVMVIGAKGTGKSTLTNWLREQMICTNLLRLSGHGKTHITPKYATCKQYNALLDYLSASANCGYNFILDSSWITEQVYCRLGLGTKNYKFDNESLAFMDKFLTLELNGYYDVYVIHLECNQQVIGQRLNRGKGVYDDIRFDAENSINEMMTYNRIMTEMVHAKSLPYFKYLKVSTDTSTDDMHNKIYSFLGL